VNEEGFVLITGSSGRIGRSVIQRLGGKYPLVGFDVVPSKYKNDNVEFIQVDITSDESVKNGLHIARTKYGPKIISVIHLAAYYSFGEGDPTLYQKITVEGTERLLREVQKFDTQQFLFSGTQLIYAPCPVGRTINEDSPIDPKWDYPKSKVKTEALIQQNRGTIPTVIMQIAGCYDDQCHSIPIANQIQRIYEKQLISHLFSGNLNHGSPFLHLDDLAEAIWLAVEKRRALPPELKVLIGEDATLSYDQIQRIIASQLYGKTFKTYQVPKWIAKIGAWILDHSPFEKNFFIKPWMIDIADDNYTLDITRARETLGWTPKNFVGHSLQKMIKSLKADPLEWYKTNDLSIPKSMKE
jgi:nucleoside-diphosphate-sugar epimerase